METLQALIRQMQQQSPHKHKLTAAALACAWKATMPRAAQERTLHTFYKQGKFFVQLNSAPLRQSLQLNKNQVLARLQAYAPECELLEVVFL